MELSSLIATLRQDLSDPDGEIFIDMVLTRSLGSAAFRLNRDLSLSLRVQAGVMTPEPTPEQEELLLLLARIFSIQVQRAATANAFQFSSADKSVNTTSQPKQWADLESSLWEEYNHRISLIRQGAGLASDPYIITPTFNPAVCELGITCPLWR